MYIKVKFFKPELNKYSGREYTYMTKLSVGVGEEVIAPTVGGDQEGIVTEINVPEGQIDERWADKIREITRYSNANGETSEKSFEHSFFGN